MYAAMLRSLRCDKTEEIRVAFNAVLDLCIPEAILDCIRDLDKDLKAKAVSDIQFASGSIQATCSYDLLSKYPQLDNVTFYGFKTLVRNHKGIDTLEASLKEYFSGCDISVTLTQYKTILVYVWCKV